MLRAVNVPVCLSVSLQAVTSQQHGAVSIQCLATQGQHLDIHSGLLELFEKRGSDLASQPCISLFCPSRTVLIFFFGTLPPCMSTNLPCMSWHISIHICAQTAITFFLHCHQSSWALEIICQHFNCTRNWDVVSCFVSQSWASCVLLMARRATRNFLTLWQQSTAPTELRAAEDLK